MTSIGGSTVSGVRDFAQKKAGCINMLPAV
jgi:hypothetical protein